MDNEIEVTNYHLNVAAKFGDTVARTHHGTGREPMTDAELYEQHPIDELVFAVTGEKVHDVPEHYLILDAFEEGYFYSDIWEADDDA